MKLGVRGWLLLLGFASFLPVFAVACIAAQNYAAAEQRTMLADLNSRATASAAKVQNYLDELQKIALTLAETHAARTHDLPGFYEIAQRIVAITDLGYVVSYVDVDGRMLLNTRRQIGENLPTAGDQLGLKKVLETKAPVVGSLFIGVMSGKPTFSIWAPILSNGKATGAVAIAVFPEELTKRLVEQQLPPGWIGTVDDAAGVIIGRTLDPDARIGLPALPGALNGQRQGLRGTYTLTNNDGVPVTSSFVKLPSSGWTAIVSVPTALLATPVGRALWFLARLGLLALAATGALVFLIGRRMGREIDEVARGALAIGHGHMPDIASPKVRELHVVAASLEAAAALIAAREAELRDSEALFRVTFEQTAVGMAHTSLDGRYLTVNDTFCAITGFTRAELLTRTPFDITHPDDLRAAQMWVAKLSAGQGETIAIERRILRKDGSIAWARNTATLLHNTAGAPERFFAIIEDITERKHFEEALRASEDRLRLARDIAGLGIIDRDFVQGLYTWTDRQWRLLGLEPGLEPPTSSIWLSAIHPDDRPAVSALRDVTWNDPAMPFDNEHRVVWPDGSVHWLKAQARALFGPDNQPTRAVCAMIDITESRENEAALRRLTDELEQRVQQEIAAREAAQKRAAQAERVQALGQLAGGIAHDINNVLQIVQGGAGMIERRPTDADGVRRRARMVLEAADRGASITRRLLVFARSGDLRFEAVNTVALLTDMRELLMHTLGTGIGVRVDAASDLPALHADKGQLETVLVNLATNARDAMAGSGVLSLGARLEVVGNGGQQHEWLGHLKPGAYICLSVGDTGAGMSSEILGRVTEPFFTTKEHGRGTGLGLAMAHGFAEQSGGGLHIESTPGHGTTVRLWFPLARADTADTYKADADGQPTTGSARLIVVDDEPLVREIITQQLEAAGYSVRSFASGTDALAALDAGEEADLIVSDLSMPGMDGIALIREAHRRRPKLPAILLTGFATNAAEIAVGGAISGTFSLLRKPVSEQLLVDRVEMLLEGAPAGGGA